MPTTAANPARRDPGRRRWSALPSGRHGADSAAPESLDLMAGGLSPCVGGSGFSQDCANPGPVGEADGALLWVPSREVLVAGTHHSRAPQTLRVDFHAVVP